MASVRDDDDDDDAGNTMFASDDSDGDGNDDDSKDIFHMAYGSDSNINNLSMGWTGWVFLEFH